MNSRMILFRSIEINFQSTDANVRQIDRLIVLLAQDLYNDVVEIVTANRVSRTGK